LKRASVITLTSFIRKRRRNLQISSRIIQYYNFSCFSFEKQMVWKAIRTLAKFNLIYLKVNFQGDQKKLVDISEAAKKIKQSKDEEEDIDQKHCI